MINPWKILGVNRKSTDEEIKEAFYYLARKHHPDVSKPKFHEKFYLVNESYQLLKNKNTRAEYIAKKLRLCTECEDCKGAGVFKKSKSITERTYTTCTPCGGSGYNINEKEHDDVVTELGRTTSTKVSRSNKRRR